jgi:hypothetical protein
VQWLIWWAPRCVRSSRPDALGIAKRLNNVFDAAGQPRYGPPSFLLAGVRSLPDGSCSAELPGEKNQTKPK